MENKPKLGVRARYAMSLRTLTQNIRLQDIPMRIVTRNRRLKSTFLSLSHTTNPQDQTSTLTNMPVPRRKPPCYQKDPHISGGEMEALKEKAELAELNAKKQRKIALKALRYTFSKTEGESRFSIIKGNDNSDGIITGRNRPHKKI